MPLTHSDALIRETARAAFWQNYESWPSIFDGLVQRISSNADQETYPWLGYAPKMQEMVGTKVAKPVPAYDYTIKNKKFEATVAIDYETRKYGKLGAVQAMVGNLGQKARMFTQSLLSDLQMAGISTNCYDGQYFFDTDHTDPGARYTTSQLNFATVNAADSTAPTDLEFATAIRTMMGQLYSVKDNEGDPVMPNPGAKFILMCPPSFYPVAQKVLVSDSLTGPIGNDLKSTYEIRVNPWITVPSSSHGYIFLYNPYGVRKPYILQVAEDIVLEDNIGMENDFMTKDVYFSAFGYMNVGYGDWRYAACYDFT